MTQKISTPVVVQGHDTGGKRRRPQPQQRIRIGPGPGQEEPVVVVQGDVEKKVRFDKRWCYRILILIVRRCCCCCRSSSSNSSSSSNDNNSKFRFVYILLLLLSILLLSLLQKLLQLYQAETHPSPFLSSKYNTLPSKMRGLAPPIELFEFPTPTERIQFYMGDWYYPINNNTTNNNYNNDNNDNTTTTNNNNYNYNNNNDTLCSTIKYWTPSYPVIGHPYIFDEKNLQQMIYKDSWKRFRLPWRPIRSYPGDAYFYHFHLQSLQNKNEPQQEEEKEEEAKNNSNDNINNNNYNNNDNHNKEKKQMVLQFGDGKDSAKFLSTPFPIMVKTRLSQRVYEERYGGSSSSSSSRSKNFTTTGTIQSSPPILGMYMIHRHYSDHFYEADEIWDTTTWNEKKSILIWRGSSSGQRRTVIEQYIDYNKNDAILPHHHHRQQQQQQQHYSIPIDIAFSEILKVHQNKFQHHSDEYYVRDALSVSQLLHYKYLLVLEGWGLASNLKWMLYSNSLVFMAIPTKVSWAMEEKLVPWVHYIPLYDNYTNLSEQLAWARTHDAECYQMVLYSRHYIERLVTSKQAQQETIEILQGIDQIYQSRYGPILQQCRPHI